MLHRGLMNKVLKVNSRFNKRVSKEEVLSASAVLEALQDILSDDIESSLKEMRKLDNYHTPKWEYLVADHLATQRTLQKVIDLVNIKGEINA